ncbi:MAG: hypothetical protein RIS47_380 [Bacteroidota bacterium]
MRKILAHKSNRPHFIQQKRRPQTPPFFVFPPSRKKKIKIRIRSCSLTIFVMTAAGYPLVVLAFGNEINRKHLYFSRIASVCCHRITPLWATATIRASSVGSTICNAVGTLGRNFPLACGHVATFHHKQPDTPQNTHPSKITLSGKVPHSRKIKFLKPHKIHLTPAQNKSKIRTFVQEALETNVFSCSNFS